MKKDRSFVFPESVYNTRSAEVVVPIINDLLKPQSILDVGCGTGTWLSVFSDSGISDYMGIDRADYSADSFHIDPAHYSKRDLEKPLCLNRKFDLVLCLEVAEHLDERFEDVLVSSLTTHGDMVLFSAAIPGQEGDGHVNEKWLSYWVSKFAGYHFQLFDCVRPLIWANSSVEVWYRQNMVLFARNIASADMLRSLSSPFLDLVHPDLFDFVSRQASRAKQYDSGEIGIRSALMSFFRSFRRF